MKTLHFTLAGALSQMLDESGLKQEQFAEATDISKGSITNYIKGRTVPRWSTVQRWAEVCEHDPDSPLLRELWEEARRSGWLYERTLFDVIDGEPCGAGVVRPFRRPELPIRRPIPTEEAA